MRIHLKVVDLTDRTSELTMIADSYPEERLLSLIRKALETNGSIIAEAGNQKLTWLPHDARPEGAGRSDRSDPQDCSDGPEDDGDIGQQEGQ